MEALTEGRAQAGRPRALLFHETSSLFASGFLWTVLVVVLLDTVLLFRHPETSSIARNLVLQLVLLGVFGWWTVTTSRTLLNAPFVFMTAVVFWHSSFLAGHYFEVHEQFSYTGKFFTYGREFVPLAVAVVTSCMVAIAVGTFIAYWQRLGRRTSAADRRAHIAAGIRAERYAVLLFTLYLILSGLYFVKEGVASAGQEYLDLYTQQSATYLYRVYQMLKFLGVPILILLFGTATRKSSLRLAYVGTLALIATTALSGARTLPFLFAVTLVVSFDNFRKRVPLMVLALAVFAAASASWMIVQARATGVGLSMFRSENVRLDSVVLWQLFWSSGGSITPVLRTMAFDPPLERPAETFVDAFVYVVPGPLVKMLAPGWSAQSPSAWLMTHSPDSAGEGFGYSLVAESFLNFGSGAWIVFLALGWLIAYADYAYRLQGSVFAGVQACSLAVLLSLHMRNDSITYARVLIWAALLIGVAALLRGPRSRGAERRARAALPLAETDGERER